MNEVVVGKVYDGLCCDGYSFTVDLIIYSVFGHCDNPTHYENDDPYAGVAVFSIEDIQEKCDEFQEVVAKTGQG